MATRSPLRAPARVPARYAALYALAEITAMVLLIWAFGLGWALVVLAATFMVGVLLAASQIKGQVVAARRRRTTPQAAVADGVLVGLGSFLVFLPGVLSTAIGIVMLAPPTRGAVRPLAAAWVTRGVARRIDAAGGFRYPPGSWGRRDYVDGDVIDGEIVGEVIDGEVIDGEVVGEAAGRLPAR